MVRVWAAGEPSADALVSPRLDDGGETSLPLRQVQARQVIAAVPWRRTCSARGQAQLGAQPGVPSRPGGDAGIGALTGPARGQRRQFAPVVAFGVTIADVASPRQHERAQMDSGANHPAQPVPTFVPRLSETARSRPFEVPNSVLSHTDQWELFNYEELPSHSVQVDEFPTRL